MEILDFIIKLLDIITWPLIIFIVLFLFKDSLRGLIARIKKINYGETTILTRMINQEPENQESEIDEMIKNTTMEKIEDVKNFFSRDTVDKFEKKQKKETGISLEDDLNKISSYLYNYSIIKGINSYFKNVYNRIYGSQIELLKKLNNKNHKMEKINKYYKKVKNKHPKVYSNFSCDKYLKYLIKKDLIERDENICRLTNIGRDFLKFIEKKDLKANKPL